MPETIMRFGGSVKALGDGKVGGYLVLFSTDSDPDLTRDYFTKSTDYDIEWADDGTAPIKSTVYYNHGIDDTIGMRKFAKGAMKLDDVGVWLEAQLAMRDDYEKAIYAMAEAGKLGWSSGTAKHLVERKQVGSAFEITSWPLGLDASLTPTPAEPRTEVIPIKAWARQSPRLVLPAAPQASPQKSVYFGAYLEADMAWDALGTLVDALFWGPVYDVLYPWDEDDTLEERMANLQEALAEFGDILLRTIRTLAAGPDAERKSAADGIKSLFNDPSLTRALRADARFDTQIKTALAAVVSCKTRAEALYEKRASDNRGLSADRRAELKTLGEAVLALHTSTAPPAPKDAALRAAADFAASEARRLGVL